MKPAFASFGFATLAAPTPPAPRLPKPRPRKVKGNPVPNTGEADAAVQIALTHARTMNDACRQLRLMMPDQHRLIDRLLGRLDAVAPGPAADENHVQWQARQRRVWKEIKNVTDDRQLAQFDRWYAAKKSLGTSHVDWHLVDGEPVVDSAPAQATLPL
jgi:hypothetical protein